MTLNKQIIEGLQKAEKAGVTADHALKTTDEIKEIMKEGFKKAHDELFMLRNSINQDITVKWETTVREIGFKEEILVKKIAELVRLEVKPTKDKVARVETAGYVFAAMVVAIGTMCMFALDMANKIKILLAHLFNVVLG